METQHPMESARPNVSLRVGNKIVRANKEVLAAESNYFHGLFNYRDNFEVSTDDIDLTEDVDSMEDLKLIVRYIHSGFVNITTRNVKKLVKMSTFFGITKLENLCSRFMLDHLTLKNCYNYYFCACQYGLSVLEYVIRGYVDTRFHDVLIYEDSIAHMTCDQLQFAVSRDLLRHCSKESIFDFLLKWMENKQELTQKHANVITEVIDYFNNLESFHNPPFEGRFSRNIIRLEEILGKQSTLSQRCAQKLRDLLVGFQRKLQSRTNIRRHTKLVSQSLKLRRESDQKTEGSKVIHAHQSKLNTQLVQNVNQRAAEVECKANCDTEPVTDDNVKEGLTRNLVISDKWEMQPREKSSKCEALFTLSHRHFSKVNLVGQDTEKVMLYSALSGLAEETDANVDDMPNTMYDLCVYDCISRTWYHIASFDKNKYIQEVNDKSELIDEVTGVNCRISFFGNEILFQDQSDQFVIMKFNIIKKDWKSIDLLDKLDGHISLSSEQFEDFKFVTGNSGTLYMVVCYILCEVGSDNCPGAERNSVRFDGFVVNPKSFCLKRIFQTAEMPYVPGNAYGHDGPFQAQTSIAVEHSSSSNELLFVYANAVCLPLVYIVNLDPVDNPKISCLLQPKLLLHDVKEISFVPDVAHSPYPEILSLEDRFLVVTNVNGNLTVKYECLYNSNVLKAVETGSPYIVGEHDLCSDQWWFILAHQGQSFWMQEEKGDMIGSYLKKVTFNTSGESAVEFHTPPPYHEPLTASATKVNRTFFSKLKPVRHFLRKKKI